MAKLAAVLKNGFQIQKVKLSGHVIYTDVRGKADQLGCTKAPLA